MKIIHLSDLHIGKRVNEFSMIEDQRYILNQIVEIIKEEKPDAVLIAGDIYDKAVPSEEAVALCDAFFTDLAQINTEVCVISGNHDSAERLSFGAKLFSQSHIHIATAFQGEVESVIVEGKGIEPDMVIYMLPFIKPSSVRRFYEDETILTYQDAVGTVLSHVELNHENINICMSHQFVMGASTCDSEEGIAVGGIDQISARLFQAFDYVALGHIHGPQNIMLEVSDGYTVPVRYCGTPLKYSFSEINHKKSVTIAEFIAEKSKKKMNRFSEAEFHLTTRPLTPLHELREIKGTYEELTQRDFYKDSNTGDYLHVILTDEEDVPNALQRLRCIYPNIMRFDYDNTRTRQKQEVCLTENVEKKTPEELFAELYELQNNQPMSDVQRSYVTELVDEIWS